MTESKTPLQWAFRISRILNTVLGPDHFPIRTKEVAEELSRTLYPNDPISLVQGANLPGFEGALFKDPSGKKGWAILYNDSVSSSGRINFTLAHEFGHYLLHRKKYPSGIQCGERDLTQWASEFGQVEHEANVFAANFLMPLDDFRAQAPDGCKITMELMDFITDRYGVSLIAALSRWIEYTSQRAVLVVSRDGYILSARSSKPAYKSGAFYRTANRPPIEVPALSLAANKSTVDFKKARDGIRHETPVWFNEPSEEIAIFSEQYDFTISIILLERSTRYDITRPVKLDSPVNRFV
ncbi:ImmA/IrrE family metallo-endopeptidase [Pseudohongiella sp. SYSU M77423]|uniref:ImmA/IrrE family metallo-endopeptidase n=1 Tax=Pseudohongiella sp. SYSU M77423 TaxID=3042312 RepID=UPI002480550E|nr:ImmA/IrrE family metallo-endopeptidase [Pseudohongiella sp. SYSU M77423]MDH7943464.1 ImmA/IrrE family metallo-endopeptidase [Pseudohongiella sp. SYSU M77423]